jgi:hypothetical protein
MSKKKHDLPSKGNNTGEQDSDNCKGKQKPSKKKKRIADTSRKSHKEEIEKGSYLTQNKQVLAILSEGKALNRHEIWALMCKRYKYLQGSSAARAISNLYHAGAIAIDKTDYYEDTGKTIRYYKLAEQQTAS